VSIQKMQNRKLFIFMPSLGIGGAERVVLRLINGFIEKGVSVTLILATNYQKLSEQIPKDVEIVQLNARRATYSLIYLVRYLRRHKPKKLLSHLHRANRIVLLAKLLARVETEIFIVEHTTASVANKEYRFIEKILINISHKYLYPLATKILHVSKGAASDLEKLLGVNEGYVGVIYNPVVNRSEMENTSTIVPHEWMKAGSIPVILSVGRLIDSKGYDILLTAFKKVIETIKCRLLILGDGPLRSKLQTNIVDMGLSEIVSLQGNVNNVYDYMTHASVFVLSSRREALPTALIEAMACGCPVVSTDCKNGPAEILQDGKYGILVPVNDPGKMAIAIIQTLRNPINKGVLKNRAIDFSVDKSVDRYCDVIFTE
jgi:glycosyltransferase involved in cell wall biosynthesis